jgi:hypothetical protein
MSEAQVVEMLRAEAAECRLSSQKNGEYNAAFWVAGIILDSLANRLIADMSRRCGDA